MAAHNSHKHVSVNMCQDYLIDLDSSKNTEKPQKLTHLICNVSGFHLEVVLKPQVISAMWISLFFKAVSNAKIRNFNKEK